jgi:hypothetical protein
MNDLSGMHDSFENEGIDAARSSILHWFKAQQGRPARQLDAALQEIGANLFIQSHALRSMLCLCGGALIEQGARAPLLTGPLLAAFESALAAAERLRALATSLFAEQADEKLEDMTEETWLQLASQDPEGLDAHDSLDGWHRPFAAVFSNDLAGLSLARQNPAITGPVDRLRSKVRGLSFVHALLQMIHQEPLVVLFPELRGGYLVLPSGVIDMGQLTILLSDPLDEPFRRVGAHGRAPAPVLATARGEGPQEIEETYEASIHFYPWPAMNPETGLPEIDRTRWEAPGGSGSHSLPPDYLPADLPPLDGKRVLLAVGPQVPGDRAPRFNRILAGFRMFNALRAGLQVTQLPAQEAARWLDRTRHP